MLGETTFEPWKQQQWQKAAAIALISALDNGNNAVARAFWLDEGKVSAVAASKPAESASKFPTSNEVKAAAVAAMLMMVNNEFFIADVDN